MLGAVAYSVAFAGFICGCLIAAIYWGDDATGPIAARLPCSGNDEATQLSIGLGGGATEHPCCHAPDADFARDDVKFLNHDGRKYL